MKTLIIVGFLFLSACAIATPMDSLTPQQVSALPASEICYWADMGDTVAVPEARRRGLSCVQTQAWEPGPYEINQCGEAAQYAALSGRRNYSVFDCLNELRAHKAGVILPPKQTKTTECRMDYDRMICEEY